MSVCGHHFRKPCVGRSECGLEKGTEKRGRGVRVLLQVKVWGNDGRQRPAKKSVARHQDVYWRESVDRDRDRQKAWSETVFWVRRGVGPP